MRRIVIVGAGLAGLRAAEALRRQGFAGTLTVVGDEPHPPYNRPPLSKQALSGADDAGRTSGTSLPCKAPDVTWRLASRATELDLDGQTVTLAGGGDLPFDGLVICTGRRARSLPTPRDMEGFFTLRSVDDAAALSAAVANDPRVAILGAGFIGCEVAATLRSRGIGEVTLLDMADLPLQPLGPLLGQRIAELHEQHGVRLRLGVHAHAFEGSGQVEAIRLRDGDWVPADLVVLALGTEVNTEWLDAHRLHLHKGAVVCDETCHVAGTSGVVAAGDVAAWPHPVADDELVCIEHWSNAAEMGAAAARNLVAAKDGRTPFVPVPTFWSDQYDTTIKSVGFFHLATDVSIVRENRQTGCLVAEGHRDGRLVGAVAFNAGSAALDYKRRLMQEWREYYNERFATPSG